MSDYHRPLYNMDVAEDFVNKVLNISKDDPNFYDQVVAIVKEERYPMFAYNTLDNQDIRIEPYREEHDRTNLRNQIKYNFRLLFCKFYDSNSVEQIR